MIITTKLSIDMQNNVPRPVISAVQNDSNSRAIEFLFYSGCTPWTIPDGITAALSYSKPDGTAGIYDKLPDGAEAFSISGTAISAIMAPQMLTVPGEVKAAIVLSDANSTQLSTFPFIVNVVASPNPGKIVSENYCYYTNLDAINEAINALQQAGGGSGYPTTTEITEESTDKQVPTAKAVYNYVTKNSSGSDSGGNVDQEKITAAINEALAEAKASGEFDGADGKDGVDGKDGYTPVKGVDYFDGNPGRDGVDGKDGADGYTPEKGKDYFDGEDGQDGSPGKDGYTPQKNVDYFDGKDGTSVTVESVSESTADGGSNVVTFSDGKTLTVRNGQKGNPGYTPQKGTDYFDGEPGKTPEKGVDYWTDADQSAVIQQVVDILGGTPVFGVVDSNNNIILTGNLAEGTYTLKYEDAEGNVTEIGTLNHTNVPEPTYTNVLTQAINSDGTPYNGGQGWKTGYRLNSAGVESANDGLEVTGFIPVKSGDVVRFANIEWPVNSGVSANKCYVWLYKSDFSAATTNSTVDGCFIREIDGRLASVVGTDSDGNMTEFVMDSNVFATVKYWDEVAYMRVSAYGITDDSIITINEPIV